MDEADPDGDATLDSDSESDSQFRAVVDAEILGTVVDHASAIVEECCIDLQPDGLRVRAVDPASVALVDLELDASAFEHYAADGTRIAVDLERLGAIVEMADRGQSVHLALDHESGTLEVRLADLEYTLGLLDPEVVRKPPDLSEMDVHLDAAVAVDAGTVDRALEAARMVADHVTLAVDPNAGVFTVEATGDTDDVSLRLAAEELERFEAGPAESLFSLDYLAAINRTIPRDPAVDLAFGEETPLRLSCPFAADSGTVEYLVSPRIAT